jgi:hypothetical protein
MIKSWLKRFAFFLGRVNEVIIKETNDPNLLALGSLLDKQQWMMSSTDLNDYEFKIFSEWGGRWHYSIFDQTCSDREQIIH